MNKILYDYIFLEMDMLSFTLLPLYRRQATHLPCCTKEAAAH